MEVFQQYLDQRLVGETMSYLRAEQPGSVMGVPEMVLRRRVERGLMRARQYGMRADTSIQALIGMMFEFGPHFDRHPVVAKLLRNERLQPDDRTYALVFEISDRVWEEMSILSGDDRWDDEGETVREAV